MAESGTGAAARDPGETIRISRITNLQSGQNAHSCPEPAKGSGPPVGVLWPTAWLENLAIVTDCYRRDRNEQKARGNWVEHLFGRVTNKLDAAGTTMFRYGYDANDRLTSRWTPAKGTNTYGYDRVGNLTNINYPVSTDLTLQYDALNRLTNMVDAVGITRYSYWFRSRLE